MFCARFKVKTLFGHSYQHINTVPLKEVIDYGKSILITHDESTVLIGSSRHIYFYKINKDKQIPLEF